MIEFLKGTLEKKEPTRLLIDVNGVGYGVNVSLRTSESFSRENQPVEIRTYFHVKEGIMELYGFSGESERDVFLKLITVSGIGPKVALRMLSAVSPEQLVSYILNGNLAGLTGLKGIGKKTAEVMIASLRSPLSKLSLGKDIAAAGPFGQDKVLTNAVLAMVTLGVKEAAAQSAVEKAAEKLGPETGTSQIITEALKLI